ncbi:glycosyltransferase family 2 protein [Psychrobacter alimentarius]|uniref:glycosyltransferase family 2 protein n=1 Tax=Psychrobacter alimentarius TaxID=261164 RepID=UPI003FCFDDB2
MSEILQEFEHYVQTQQYNEADSLIKSLLQINHIANLKRTDALQFLYRIGYVYPDLALKLCSQRNDVPKPFIDTLKIALETIPPLRFYSGADTLVAIKIALMRHKPLLAKLLVYKFYRQYGLQPISLVENYKLTIGNNYKKLKENNNTHKVSIIVTTYNSAKFIENCINSLLNQTANNIEIIVVDDASTDNTVEILKNYSSIKIIELTENLGTYYARNIGIGHSSGEFITFQDSDDWSHPERVWIQLQELLHNNDVLANFSNFFRVDEITGLPSCRQNYPLLRLNISSMMIHKQILEEIGGFDDEHRIESDKRLLNKILLNYKENSISYIKLPLAIGLLREGSLTKNKRYGFNKYGYSPLRDLV